MAHGPVFVTNASKLREFILEKKVSPYRLTILDRKKGEAVAKQHAAERAEKEKAAQKIDRSVKLYRRRESWLHEERFRFIKDSLRGKPLQADRRSSYGLSELLDIRPKTAFDRISCVRQADQTRLEKTRSKFERPRNFIDDRGTQSMLSMRKLITSKAAKVELKGRNVEKDKGVRGDEQRSVEKLKETRHMGIDRKVSAGAFMDSGKRTEKVKGVRCDGQRSAEKLKEKSHMERDKDISAGVVIDSRKRSEREFKEGDRGGTDQRVGDFVVSEDRSRGNLNEGEYCTEMDMEWEVRRDMCADGGKQSTRKIKEGEHMEMERKVRDVPGDGIESVKSTLSVKSAVIHSRSNQSVDDVAAANVLLSLKQFGNSVTSEVAYKSEPMLRINADYRLKDNNGDMLKTRKRSATLSILDVGDQPSDSATNETSSAISANANTTAYKKSRIQSEILDTPTKPGNVVTSEMNGESPPNDGKIWNLDCVARDSLESMCEWQQTHKTIEPVKC